MMLLRLNVLIYCNSCVCFVATMTSVVKVRGLGGLGWGGLSPLLPFEPPAIV